MCDKEQIVKQKTEEAEETGIKCQKKESPSTWSQLINIQVSLQRQNIKHLLASLLFSTFLY